jgi:Tol biopolymer transport system component
MKVVSARFLILSFLLLVLISTSGCTSPKALTTGTYRVSVASNGKQGDQRSKLPSISADGRYVAFASDATNLVKGDANSVTDIFVRDLAQNKTTRVSVSSKGKEGDGASYMPFISQDGRYVTFTSEADNLVEGDTNRAGDVFVYDRQTEKIELISIGLENTPGNDLSFWSSISADGRYVVFMSNATNLVEGDLNDAWDVFMRDRDTSKTYLVSIGFDGKQANSQSEYPVISADGQSIAFASDATNIVPGDTNGYRDVFVFGREARKVFRVSIANDGTQANEGTQAFVISISANGQVVAFPSLASNLVAGDTNNVWDIFVHDRETGETSRVSVSSNGSQADAGSYGVSVSSDGRYVAFGSNASNLVADDTNGMMDVFVHDRQTGQTERISVASDGTQGNDGSGYTLIAPNGIDFAYGTLISSDGSRVVYMSNATNLVADDTNAAQDIFIYVK